MNAALFAEEPNVPILFDNVRCIGSEEDILDCEYTTDHMCSHDNDIAIICHRKTAIACIVLLCVLIHHVAASECEVDNGGCDHYCTETLHSYTCSCYPGYTLEQDGHSCIGK